jgi:hypothetical protein
VQTVRRVLLLIVAMFACDWSHGDDVVDPVVSVSTRNAPLIDVAHALLNQTQYAFGTAKELEGVDGISVEATDVPLSAVLLQLKDYNICAWKLVLPQSDVPHSFIFGYCNGELPFPPEGNWVPFP